MSTVEGPIRNSTPVQTTTIRPTTGWPSLRMGEVWRYRELLYFFVWRNLKVRYRQTAIGTAWALLQPLALVAIFSLILGRVPGLAPEGISYALFALAAIVPWTFMAHGVDGAAMSVVALILLSGAAALFMVRLFIGPSVADRVMAFDGLLITVMCAILVAVARRDWSTSVDAVLLIALVGFIGTGVLARYVERRGG